MQELLRLLQQSKHRVLAPAPLGIGGSALDLDAGFAGEFAQGVGKLDAVTTHDVRKQVAALAAAEALVAAAVGKDEEGRRFLAVEGAQALPVTAGALQPNVTADEFDRVQPGLDFLYRRRHLEPSLRHLPTRSAVQVRHRESRVSSARGCPSSAR